MTADTEQPPGEARATGNGVGRAVWAHAEGRPGLESALRPHCPSDKAASAQSGFLSPREESARAKASPGDAVLLRKALS